MKEFINLLIIQIAMPKEKELEKNLTEKNMSIDAEKFSVADNSDTSTLSSVQKRQQKEKQYTVAVDSKRDTKNNKNFNELSEHSNNHSEYSHSYHSYEEKPKKSKLWYFLLAPIAFIGFFFFVLIVILVISLISMSSSDGIDSTGNVAVIPLKGVIVGDAAESFFDDGGLVSSTEIIAEIEKAEKNTAIKAIIFEINSPGGSGVASDEIAAKIKSVNKTTVAWVRELGASGAYWVASATDHIVAHRMSFVGSIGVIGSYLEFSGLMEKYGIGYERLTAGKYKDMGIPFRKLTIEEKDIFQSELDDIHAYFIEEVAANRKLDPLKVKELATGQVYIGSEAQKLGLIDDLGGKQQAVNYIQQQLNITASLVEYKKPKSFFDIFRTSSDRTAFFIGKGIGNSILTTKVSNQLEITT